MPVEWAKNRFRLFIDQLGQMQEQADLVIIGGDVFDRLPTMDEVELYFEFVEGFTKPTIIYSGNHEMLKKDTTFLSNLMRATNRLNPNVIVVDEYYSDHGVEFVPYNKLKEFEQGKHPWPQGGRILCTHVRGEIPPHVKPEINLDLLNSWNIVLAGDLHSYDNSQRNILYPGSPYTTSFHRHSVDTGAILLDSDTLDHVWLKFKLPQLIRKTVGVSDPKPPTDFDHTIYEVEGDMHELGELEDSDLIANKVLKRDSDTALILDQDMTLSEEVAEYLKFILNLPDQTVDLALKELQNYADKIEQ